MSCPKVTTAPAGPVASTDRLGRDTNDGAVVSRTLTTNVPRVTSPAWSVARHVTVVVPIGNVEPLGGTQRTVTSGSATSSAVGGVNITNAPVGPVASAATSAGTSCKTGGAAGRTWTGNEALAVWPNRSTAVTTTTVVP